MAAPPEQARIWQVNFGHRVREAREAAGLSQLRVAEAANVHATYLSSLERGQRNVSLVNIHMLANALAIDACELLKPESD